MRADFAAAHLRCPVCDRDRTLRLRAAESDAREVREGTLRCTACGIELPVHRGVAELMPAPPEHVVREAAGLERYTREMKAAGWDRDRIRRLPYVEDGYWFVQSSSMHQLLTTIDFQPGQWLLDVGSNTCWASNHFAVRGLRTIALDISTVELQGLYTSDFFLDDGTAYFERVLGSMNEIPLASGSLDYVYCCEVLHHNDPPGLRRTFQEAFRVLKPGGRLLMINETIKTIRDPVGVHTEGVAQWEGYEHAYWALRYRFEAVRAGFATEILEPRYRWPFGEAKPRPGSGAAAWRGVARAARSKSLPAIAIAARPVVPASSLGRRVYLLWLNHVHGGVQLNMIATKPPGAPGARAAPGTGPARARSHVRSGAAGARAAARVLRGSRRRAARSG